MDFLATGILKSKREARDLIDAGGIYIDDETVDKTYFEISKLKNKNEFLLRVGKKKYFKILF